MVIYFIIYGILLLLFELLYLKIAEKLEIVDRPNSRSSHDTPIIRGGGIIFIIGIWLWFIHYDYQWPFFLIGATFIAVISFLDDLKPQYVLNRFLVHLISILILFYQLELFEWNLLLLVTAGIVSIGTLNAYNFMDGINGITGVNLLVCLISCLYINSFFTEFTDSSLLISLIIAAVVFLYFNFRKKAKCFAGDVGSITLAFVQVFLLLQLIQKTGSFFWAGMFLIFGIDSVVTIGYRIKRRENIFKPHRTHLYQFLSNELRRDHRLVSCIYGIAQLLFNVVLIYSIKTRNSLIPVVLGIIILATYFLIRIFILRKLTTSSSIKQ